jgi:hypothetical protein
MFTSFQHWLNEAQTIKVDNVDLPFVIIPKEKWPERKNDPTEYDSEHSVVRVRSDYDYKKDPINWMKHELIHYLYHKKGIKDDEKEYPENNTEAAAYKHQFKTFKKQGIKNIEDIIDKLGKKHHLEILKKYWDKA